MELKVFAFLNQRNHQLHSTKFVLSLCIIPNLLIDQPHLEGSELTCGVAAAEVLVLEDGILLL